MQGPNLPPDFEFYSPEQQAQIMQAWEATQKPVFIYVFPALISTGKVWVVWLLAGGILHLFLTMFGGRSSAGTTYNIVAWAALPFAIRDAVRIIALLSTRQAIANPGLTGFAPQGEGNLQVCLSGLLAQVDIYVIWHIVLLAIGVYAATKIRTSKVVSAVLITVILILVLGALVSLAGSFFSSLNVVRPFFF
jgi:hypothetical protein